MKLRAGRGKQLRRPYLYDGRVSVVPRRPADGPVLHRDGPCTPLFLPPNLLLQSCTVQASAGGASRARPGFQSKT